MSEGSMQRDLISAGSLARSVVKGIARATERVADGCRGSEFRAVLTVIDDTQRRGANIFLTGVGKSGLVARRAADAWASAGMRAHFLDPVNAIHGDMGRVRSHDLLIAISQSGRTEEVIRAVVSIHSVQCLAITGDVNSPLANCAVISLNSDVENEIIPYQATAAQNAWCDALMAGWLALHPEASVAANHPGGSIGQRHAT